MNSVAALPILIVSGAALLALLAGVLPGRAIQRLGPPAVAVAGVLAGLVASVALWGDRQEAYAGNLRADRFSLLLNAVFLVAALAALLLGWREPAAVDRRGEFTGLLLLSTVGMMLVGGAGDLITLFLGVELLSVALYVLCAIELWRERSLESGLKYLIIGALGSAIFLYGLAMLYGATGATGLSAIGERLADPAFASEPLLIAAMALIVAGLGFKASAVPFHMWTPDVYEGAPTPVTAFMATATKAAALAAFLRLFAGAMGSVQTDWKNALAAVAVATILIGNVAALLQRNMKRLLAYSGIAQAGYLLIGVVVGTERGAEATIYYLLAYLAMTMAAFAVVVIREREVEDGERLEALAGYGRERPLLGAVMTLAMLSLAGFPPLVGFVGKFLLFGSAVEAHMTWLAVIGAVGSMISLGYYLRVLAVLWLGSPEPGRPQKLLTVPPAAGAVAVISGAAVIAMALAASPIIDLCTGAARAVLAP
ncbi:MAG: NADH-quinone oxidoreductase subunit [Miltoncostaeaceae bacterium]|nr:NADH-quinone oxidoreductase subunit [Miltoncostaeaceae bacterium]